MAPPIVKAHAPASLSAWIRSAESTLPAAMTGPAEAATTERTSAGTSPIQR